MNEQQFLGLVEEILEVETGTIRMTDVLKEIDWDSLADITFIAELDSQLNVSVDANELSNSVTVSDLFGFVNDPV
ncbi:acyl carrier protein [Lysinibacter cavernae]|uniref:Acyl carrier protein n=1 Tax=Lysinibacter cavernae TaxID=1640652 RepID=A0A7X5TU83_9MICO|nr:acyl carrier protein [Lysinibacter cavernae]NIH54113.1 acyl carrier protein [Lysinibacter cavernae]